MEHVRRCPWEAHARKLLAKRAFQRAIGNVKQWFYSEDGLQKGPVPEETLREMHRKGALKDDSLVWCDGMAEWRKISSLPGWDDSPYATPAMPAQDDPVPVNWDGYEATGPQARPWVRYWARTVDTLLAGFLIGIPLFIIFPALAMAPSIVVGMIVLACTLVTEPLLFALFGTTPGKALFLVRVRNRDGSRLSFSHAFGRRLGVLIRGEGLGIPIVALVTQIMSYSRLSNQGITSWDEQSGFVVSHRQVEWWRWLAFIGIIIGFIALIALVDFGLVRIGHLFSSDLNLSLDWIFGKLFYPMAWAMGVPSADIANTATLLGQKLTINEFVAFSNLTGGQVPITSEKGLLIVSVAICGFANFSSVGMQIGGIGELAPERRSDLAKLGLKALLCGTLASYMSATLAGIIH